MPKKNKKLRKKPKKPDTWYQKLWYFIWYDNSIWNWIVILILIYVIIKFLVFPGVGLVFGTSTPLVVVISNSMEHNGMLLEKWWAENKDYYLTMNITKADFETYPFKNGFNKGDLMFIKGKKPEDIKVGDVIVFKAQKSYSLIHRVIKRENKTEWIFQTKGDNTESQIEENELDETRVYERQILGKATLRIPYIGYVKIWFTELIKAVVGDNILPSKI